MAHKKKIAVIGAGIGGLSAAISLAHMGYDVHVFERNNEPGGKAAKIEKTGFRFDAGPSLITMPFVLENLFSEVGEKISDYLNLKKLEVICKYFYSDGTIINAYSDINKFACEVENNTEDSADSIRRYLKYSKKIYELTAELFLFRSFNRISTFLNLKALKTLLNFHKLDIFRTMHNANSAFFKDIKTIQLFDRYATYNGSNPFSAPATLNIIQHVEYNLGAYIPGDGIYSITDSLYKLALKKGVNFNFSCSVDSIITGNKIVKGIVVDNSIKNFGTVVSNADVNFTYEKLLKDSKSKKAVNYKKAEPSSSALVFYWGINRVHPDLEIHNILFSSNYKKEFMQLFEEKICPDDPTIYIYISSKYKKDDSPAECENWFVMINAPHLNSQNWDEEIKKSKQTIMNKINKILKIDLSNKIVFEDILTPEKIENKTSSSRGSIYGISSNTKFAAFLRQQNKSKNYKGLYFAGGSAHPGGGIPLVILSGKITSELIEKYEQ